MDGRLLYISKATTSLLSYEALSFVSINDDLRAWENRRKTYTSTQPSVVALKDTLLYCPNYLSKYWHK